MAPDVSSQAPEVKGVGLDLLIASFVAVATPSYITPYTIVLAFRKPSNVAHQSKPKFEKVRNK